MQKLDIDGILKQFSELRVLVIGDVMLDAYVHGNVDRISPEAPVPIVDVQRKDHRLGGAANVALNIKALGAVPILCGLVGDDEPAQQIADLLKRQEMSAEGLVASSTRQTTVKTRVVSGSQQLLRFDQEDTHVSSAAEQKALLAVISKVVTTCQAIIFEDYDKGCIDQELISQVVKLARQHNIPTIVDPKIRNFSAYQGVTLLKPNLNELRQALDNSLTAIDDGGLVQAAEELHECLSFDQLLTTLSEKGVFYWDRSHHGIIDAHHRAIADVSGAGDTVVAMAGLCTALRLPLEAVAQLANLAGGIVCEEAGVVPIDPAKLISEHQRSV